MDARRLKIQKTDRRMTGHNYFKYRLELQWSAFSINSQFGSSEPYHDRATTFCEFCQHLTSVYGYGPSVDDAGSYFRSFGAPRWAFRLTSNTHTYAIYMADDDVRDELEKILAFKILKQPETK